ncbi:protein containing DUF1566 [Sulfurimonas gotlandica GD1]|uniref:Protein containing DUF1566 n=1 Tax=Sulfurimonas gotlandica (strain DSM 19862 / JCM 16533 / GD1) TaxID=929558 RepID=B6BLF7_SULGG|nr:DUF1566 domain-containing protein [Sulfurimonas gotlandica]EDZ61993.1 conserved domain protein [Sulfurimonas gotlandica GD1]EHP28612.1 protein containing DUF1566 [Sulfurimonas gotlandica GD1]
MKKLLFTGLLLVASTLFAERVFVDKSTSLIWQDHQDNQELSITYYQSQEYCANLVIGKYSDFRLPTLVELQSIVDYKSYDPAIKKGFDYVSNEYYWSTTPFADDAKTVWLIHFRKGERTVKAMHYDRHIRCVQSSK